LFLLIISIRAFIHFSACTSPSTVNNTEPFQVNTYAVGEVFTVTCKRAHGIDGPLVISAAFYCQADGGFSLSAGRPSLQPFPHCIKSTNHVIVDILSYRSIFSLCI